MKIFEVIQEAPLPDDWDKEQFSDKNSFQNMLTYAMARADKLGYGSARAVVEIPYQGRRTALKIALDDSGLAQNEAEIEILSKAKSKGIDWALVPMIDYDTKNSKPRWLHVELAPKPINVASLAGAMGFPEEAYFRDLMQLAIKFSDIFTHNSPISKITDHVDMHGLGPQYIPIFVRWIEVLMTLLNDFDVDIIDFDNAVNWGLYRGNPVLIDLGFTNNVRIKYYR